MRQLRLVATIVHCTFNSVLPRPRAAEARIYEGVVASSTLFNWESIELFRGIRKHIGLYRGP